MRQRRPDDAPPVHIEPETGWAWRGGDRLDLAPKVFAVLRHLVEHPQHLITKDALLAAAWGDTVVSEAALTSCIRDLRRALGDSSRTPRYIETVHRRGFRFIGPVGAPPAVSDARPAPPAPAATTLVGRDTELARLHALFTTAAAGERRLVFVTGEAGIGKTTLVEAFLAGLGDGIRIGRGQCVEQYGASEPYLPVLEALGRMGRERGRDGLIGILRQHAPTWLVQLPGLLDDEALQAVQRRAHGTTRERMQRELIEALDALGTETPVVLLLEDLHWSDETTIDLLAMFARRRDPARVLVLGTYRPADVADGGHPLRALTQELRPHGRCHEIALDFLGEAAVAQYLARRFGAAFPPGFALVLHENTGGNPLFLVNVVDDLLAQDQLREVAGRWQLATPVDRVGAGLPHTLAQMVEKQIERLTPREQAVLAVGSVVGAEFSAALAAVDGIDPREAERCCEALARRGQLLRAAGAAAWPDGTVAGRYAFIHAVYRNVLYGRVSIGHRVGLHLRIGMRLEEAHGPHAGDVAGELAMHFEEGRDFARAARYRRQAAETALRHYGYREAASHARRAIEVLAALPGSAERDREELGLQTLLGAAQIASSGWAAPEVAGAYARARELCAPIGVTPQVFPVLLGLCGYHLMRGDIPVAEEVSQQLLAHAEATQDAAMVLGAHNTAAMASFYRGDFVAALAHVERSRTLYDPEQHGPNRVFSVDHDPGVSFAAHGAFALLVLGHLDRATASMRECLAYAHAVDHPFSVAMAYNFASMLHQILREPAVVRELEEVRAAYARKHDFDVFLLLGEIYRGWLATEDGRLEEGLAQMRSGLAAYRAIGAELGRPTFLGMLAAVCRRLDRRDEGLAAIGEAFEIGARTGLRYWDAELWRLKGTLVAAETDAEDCFLRALEIARRQQAKLLELRAATSVGRLWQRQGKADRARTLLAETSGWFTEGLGMADVTDARALLAGLEAPPPGAPRSSSRQVIRRGT